MGMVTPLQTAGSMASDAAVGGLAGAVGVAVSEQAARTNALMSAIMAGRNDMTVSVSVYGRTLLLRHFLPTCDICCSSASESVAMSDIATDSHNSFVSLSSRTVRRVAARAGSRVAVDTVLQVVH